MYKKLAPELSARITESITREILGTSTNPARGRQLRHRKSLEGTGTAVRDRARPSQAPEGEEEQVIVHSVRLTLVSRTQLQGTLEFELGGQRVSAKLTFSKEP